LRVYRRIGETANFLPSSERAKKIAQTSNLSGVDWKPSAGERSLGGLHQRLAERSLPEQLAWGSGQPAADSSSLQEVRCSRRIRNLPCKIEEIL
jgi:hypothetical protein